jgi:urea carboxylase-associated protein 2
MPDTLKAQHIARLTKGFVLYSDMGRILCSIIDDTVGWHDPLGGASNAKIVQEKYGTSRYQEHRNDCHRNGHDGFLIEMGKWGLTPRDLEPNVNFFSRVDVSDNGSMTFALGNSKPGAHIDLRAEMNVLTILNTCQHPLDPNPKYEPKRVHVSVRRVAAPGANDACRISRPENGRGFTLTERYFQ